MPLYYVFQLFTPPKTVNTSLRPPYIRSRLRNTNGVTDQSLGYQFAGAHLHNRCDVFSHESQPLAPQSTTDGKIYATINYKPGRITLLIIFYLVNPIRYKQYTMSQANTCQGDIEAECYERHRTPIRCKVMIVGLGI